MRLGSCKLHGDSGNAPAPAFSPRDSRFQVDRYSRGSSRPVIARCDDSRTEGDGPCLTDLPRNSAHALARRNRTSPRGKRANALRCAAASERFLRMRL